MSDLRARVLAEISAAPSPTRAEARARAGLAFGAAIALTLAGFFALGGVAIGGRSPGLVAFAAASAAAVALGSTWLVLGARSMVGRPPRVLAGGGAAGVVALFAIVVVAAAIWPSGERVPRLMDAGCAMLTVLEGALPLAALLWWRRGLDVVQPAITGAALGLAAGAWSAALAYLRCFHAAAEHGALAHAAPALVLMAVGAAVGAVVLRLR